MKMEKIRKSLCKFLAGAVFCAAWVGLTGVEGLAHYEEGENVYIEENASEDGQNYAENEEAYKEAEVFTLSIGQTVANVFGAEKQSDVSPIVRNGRTMLPARFVAENLGASVLWEAESRTVIIANESVELRIIIDSDIAFVNGTEQKLDSPAFVENNRTYTPVRFIAENLGSAVSWDAETQTVIMSKPANLQINTLIIKDFAYKYEEGGEMAEYNEGAVGGMVLSGEVVAPAEVKDVLIATWSDMPFDGESLEESAQYMAEIWKQEGFEIYGQSAPFFFETAHPVDAADLGKKMYVLLVGVDEEVNVSGYAVIEEIIGSNSAL